MRLRTRVETVRTSGSRTSWSQAVWIGWVALLASRACTVLFDVSCSFAIERQDGGEGMYEWPAHKGGQLAIKV